MNAKKSTRNKSSVRRPSSKADVEIDVDETSEAPATENSRESAEKGMERPRRPTRLRQSKPPGVDFLRVENALPSDLESEWGKTDAMEQSTGWTRFVLLSLLLAGAIVWLIHPTNPANSAIKVTPDMGPPQLPANDLPKYDANKLTERIIQAVNSYADATTIEDLLRVSRHAERVRPLMEDYYARHPLAALGSGPILAFQMLTLGDQNGLSIWMVSLESQNGGKVNLIVETREDKEALIDWETAVTYQPQDWDEFLETRPPDTMLDFRVYVTPDTLFSHEFDDLREWDCYQLTAPEGREYALGYVKADSPTAQMMRSWFKQYPDKPARMILCLTIPKGLSSPRGVVIDHAKSARWMYVVPPIKN